MNTHRVFIALISAAFALVAAPKADALVYNLNTARSIKVDTVDGPSYFSVDFQRTAGSGVINPFLSLQASPTEKGFNVDSGNLNTDRNGTYTITQRVSNLATITVNGIDYYSFLVDVNEPGSAASIISLDTIRIYTSSNLYTDFTALNSGATKQFDLDSLSNNTIIYDYKGNSGSGQGDIAFLIPTSVLAGVNANDYFYMYQEWGGFGPAYSSDAGYEETRHGGDITFVPIPETNAIFPILAVLGVVVAGPFVRRCFHP